MVESEARGRRYLLAELEGEAGGSLPNDILGGGRILEDARLDRAAALGGTYFCGAVKSEAVLASYSEAAPNTVTDTEEV